MVDAVGGFGGASGPPGRDFAAKMFQRADSNSDGSIDLTEFKAASPSNATNHEGMFKSIDSDGDGKISKSENSSFLEKIKGQPPPGPPPSGSTDLKSQLQSLLASGDSEGKGSVNTKDQKSLVESLRQLHQQQLSKTNSYDSSGKGLSDTSSHFDVQM